MLGCVGRRKQPGAVLHGLERIGRIGPIHPRVDPAVRVIDADAIAFLEHAVEPRPDERRDGPGTLLRAVLPGIEHGESPRLALGIRAARRGAQQIVGEEGGPMRPDVLRREPHLQVGEERQPELGEP